MKKLIILFILSVLPAVTILSNTSRDIGKEPALSSGNIAKWIIFYTNIERVQKGLKPLMYDPILEQAADWQAKYCSGIKNLSHNATTRGMETPNLRIEHYGRRCGFCGENLTVKFSTNTEGKQYYIKKDSKGTYFDYGNYMVYWRNEQQIGYAMVDSWMNSKYHRENILNPGYLWIGAGAVKGVYNNNKAWYGGQVFNGYGGLPVEFLKIDYELSGLFVEEGSIEGKNAYLMEYDGKLKPCVIEVQNDSDFIMHELLNKGNKFILIKTPGMKYKLFAAIFNSKDGIYYPVKELK